ncbi:hypothetical protein DAI22_03g139400 [Oryza sativa Japonica Group]|nr:hypothetical protein DAI22_03g139400 [Oryza sativa Japonica Group]
MARSIGDRATTPAATSIGDLLGCGGIHLQQHGVPRRCRPLWRRYHGINPSALPIYAEAAVASPWLTDRS